MNSANKMTRLYKRMDTPTKLGMAFYDADQRLEACNDAYIEIYHPHSTLLSKGSTLLALIEDQQSRTAHESGKQVGQRDFRSLMINRASFWDEFEAPDGRRFCLFTHPTPDGGWASVCHEVADDLANAEFLGYLVRHDPVTECPNRFVLQARLDQAMRCSNGLTALAVMMIKLEHIQDIIDRHGLDGYDIILSEIATRIRRVIGHQRQLAYISGDQFAVLLPIIPDAAHAAKVATQIRLEIGLPFEMEGRVIRIESNVGIAISPRDAKDSATLMRYASIALSRARSESQHEGQAFYCGQYAALVRRQYALEADLRRVLTEGDIIVHYQPIIDAQTSRVMSFEALLRWSHPDYGEVSPLEIIEIAEENGLIHDLGALVLRQACLAASKWRDDVSISVNVSPSQFSKSDLIGVVAEALKISGLSPSRLTLEVTEAVLIDPDQATDTFQKLRALGVKITLDDFGIGYSSFSYLRTFKFDAVKMDRTFVQGLNIDILSSTMIHCIASLAQSLGMPLIAEGIETERQREIVSALGCTHLQGFLCGRPSPWMSSETDSIEIVHCVRCQNIWH